MKNIIVGVLVLGMAGTAFAAITSQNWKISEDYSVKFSSVDPSGVFKGLQGNISFDEKSLAASKFDVTVDVATINTGNGMQNTHAKSEKWFDAEKYPQIKFTSSEIVAAAAGYQAKGILEMHGVKKEITIPFTFKNNIFNGAIEVNRNDFGIGDPNHQKVPPTLKVELNVPVSK